MNSFAPSSAPLRPAAHQPIMVDGFGRQIRYLRLSITDRCDLRCTYCMPHDMRFMPRKELLTLDELDRLASAFIARGVQHIRITGGEPLVRGDCLDLVARLMRHKHDGALKEVTITSNGTRLAQNAARLADLGVERINVSLDTLDAERFASITRLGRLDVVLGGIDAALAAGIKVKINMVTMADTRLSEIIEMARWAHGKGMDISLIETMPMAHGEKPEFLSLAKVEADLAQHWTLHEAAHRTSGPSRYMEVQETGGRIGFIAPMSGNFCASCNRVRVTAAGRLYPCLGHDLYFDFAKIMRQEDDMGNMAHDDAALDALVARAMHQKPEQHDFVNAIEQGNAAVLRTMSATGG